MIEFNREFKQRLTAFFERSLRLPEITVSPRNIAVGSSFNRPRLPMGRYSLPCHVAHRVDLECRGCVGFCRATFPFLLFIGGDFRRDVRTQVVVAIATPALRPEKTLGLYSAGIVLYFFPLA